MTLCTFHILASLSMPQLLPLSLIIIVLAVFCVVLVSNRIILRRVRQRVSRAKTTTEMMNKAMEISHNNVVRYDVLDRHIYKLYGELFTSEGLTLEEWTSHVHPDDVEKTLDWFRQIIYHGLKRAEFYYRWNFSTGQETPRWGYIHNVSVPEYIPGTKRVRSVISTLKDETQLQQQEERVKELTSRYMLVFENSIIGLSFYTPDGWLLDANKLMREICHFDNDNFDEFFSKTNLFELSPFRECCDPKNITELWICTQSIVPEREIHDYLEIRLHPLLDSNGQVAYIAIAVRNVTEERQLYLQAKLNDIQIQQANERIMAYETELRYMMDSINMQAFRINLDRNSVEFYSGLSTTVRTISLDGVRDIFVQQNDDFVKSLDRPAEAFAQPLVYTGLAKPVITGKYTESQWVQINCIPEHDERGRLTGSFGVWRNISDEMKQQDQLKRETERANDSGRLKSVFLANMTHEIRTPLNAIVGFSDLLQAIESPEDRKEMLRAIHNNCDMLLRLINDILVLSNVDANAMEIVPEDVDLAQEFNDLCQSLAQRVQEQGVEFQSDNPYTMLRTRLDSSRLDQVMTNFVTNAVKYTHQGHIRVGIRVEEREGLQGIYAYCEDTGTGIPEDQVERIFERFVKLNDYVQGTGLGLSICKAIIQRCNGKIGVESQPGQGSTFWFWVPAAIESQELSSLPS